MTESSNDLSALLARIEGNRLSTDRMDVIADSGSGYECTECATAEVES